MASEFCQEYLQLCREKNIEPHNALLKCLQRPCASPGKNNRASLNLQATGLDEKTCAVLGKLLSLDHIFEEVKLADCSLPDAGVSHIVCGLNTNTGCVRLDLKGNNIRGKSVDCLGRMLRQNRSIERLVLQWNNIGMLDEPFMVFCEGLGGNSSVTHLDLRSNQINHNGAIELGVALKRNTTLRSLDLRWNSIGLVGGRALLESFKFNKSIDNVQLAGNDMPSDIVKSIEQAAQNNAEIHNLAQDYSCKTACLTKELKKSKRDGALQFDDLMTQLEEKDEKLRNTNKVAAHKVAHFKEVLSERKSAFSTLTSKLARTESELLLAEQKAKDTEILLQKERSDREIMSSSYRHELQNSRQEHTLLENRLSGELAAMTEKCNDVTAEVIDLRQKTTDQKKVIHELKETIASLEADVKIASANHQDKLHKEQLKNSQALKETVNLKNKEIEQVHSDRDVIEKTLRDHVNKVERQRMDADEEISKMKATLISERMNWEDELSQTRHKLKADQDFHIHHMEDKLKLLHTAKDDLQQLNSQQSGVISDLQTKSNSLQMEVDNMRRQLDQQQQSLNAKQNDIQAAKLSVQIVVDERTAELEQEVAKHKNIKEKLTKLEKKYEEKVCRFESDLERKNDEIKHLKEKIHMRESDIAWMREETAQRAQALQTAVRNFSQPLSATKS